MQINKLALLGLLLFARLFSFADIALPKPEKLQEARYYFANVDSFPAYDFFVKKSANLKTYRIKQDAAFLIKPNGASGKEKLEVWALSKQDGKKTNSFILTTVKPDDIYGGNTAYIAILFSFDKNNNLLYKQTVMKPDCYNKKNPIPFIAFDKPASNDTGLPFLAIVSLLLLMSVFICHKRIVRDAYI